jgi:hypothetical protein
VPSNYVRRIVSALTAGFETIHRHRLACRSCRRRIDLAARCGCSGPTATTRRRIVRSMPVEVSRRRELVIATIVSALVLLGGIIVTSVVVSIASGGSNSAITVQTTRVGATTVPLPVTVVDIDHDGKIDFVANANAIVPIPRDQPADVWKDYLIPVAAFAVPAAVAAGLAVYNTRRAGRAEDELTRVRASLPEPSLGDD